MTGAEEKHIKNKLLTKRKLIDAVAEIFHAEGYQGLGVNKVARIAGVSKKLIYRYFGTFEQLIEAYVVEIDYWMRLAEQIRQSEGLSLEPGSEAFVADLLVNQFRGFLDDRRMQELIRWEISTGNPLMKSIHQARELLGQQLFELTDKQIPDKTVNFRAISALLVGGIYYTVLHADMNGGLFSDVDLATKEGREAIVQAIRLIVRWAYSVTDLPIKNM